MFLDFKQNLNQLSKKIVFFIIVTGFSNCWDEPVRNHQSGISKPSKKVQSEEFKPILKEDYEENHRYIWQKPDMIIQQLGDLSQKIVVDLGAGEGYFTFRLVPKAQKVIAVDIAQRYLAYIDSLKSELIPEFRPRLETRLATLTDANLQPAEADVVVMVNTYMYIQNRVAYLKRLKKGISIGGKVLIVDYKERNLPVGPPTNIKIPLPMVEKELTAAGFKKIKSDDTALDYQYIITATNE
jgi:SAM-dependent methyltransferase